MSLASRFRRTCIALLAWAGLVGLVSSHAYAQSSPKTMQAGSARFNVEAVPLQQWHQLMKGQPLGWVVTYGEWVTQWKALQQWVDRKAQTPLKWTSQWTRMDVTGRVVGQLVRLRIVLHLQMLQKGWHRLSVPLNNVQLAGVRLQGVQGTVTPAPQGVYVWVKGPAKGSVALNAGVGIRDVPRGKVIQFSLPKVSISTVSIQLPVGQEVHLQSPGLRVQQTASSTRVVGGLSGENSVHFRYRRAEQKATIKPIYSAHVQTSYHLRPKTQWLEASLKVAHRVGRLRTFFLQVPQGFRLYDLQVPKSMDVQFEALSHRARIVVSRWPNSRTLSGVLKFVRQRDIPASMELAQVAVDGAYSQEGHLHVRVDRRLRHRVLGIQQSRRLPKKASNSSRDSLLRFQTWNSQSKVTVAMRTVVPKVFVHQNAILQIQPRQARMTWNLRLNMREGSMYKVEGSLSPGWTLFTVTGRSNAELDFNQQGQSWWAKLPKRLDENQSQAVTLVAVRNINLAKAKAKPLLVPSLVVNQATFQTGQFVAKWPRYFKGTLDKIAQLMPVWSGPKELSSKLTWMKWRVLGAKWGGAFALQRKAAKAIFQSVNSFRLQNGWVQAEWKLLGRIRGAGVRSFSFEVQDQAQAMGTPQVTVQNNRVLTLVSLAGKAGAKKWVVRLAREHFGPIQVSVVSQWRHSSKTVLQPPLVVAAGHRLRRGFVRIFSTDNLEVKPNTKSLHVVDPLEIPVKLGGRKGAPLLAYRYLAGAQPSLSLSLVPHQAQSLQDVVIRSELFSISQHGTKQWRVRVSYRLWTRGGASFQFQLPPQATLWSILRNRKGLKPLVRGGNVSVQIPETTRRSGHKVEVVYLLPSKGLPLTRGSLSFGKPKHTYPILKSEWNLYLPKAYRPLHIAGSLKAMDTVQPRSLLLQIYSMLRRELGDEGIIICLAFFALLWWLKFWIASWIVGFFRGVIWFLIWARKGIFITVGIVLGLGLAFFLLTMSAGPMKRSTSYRYKQMESKPASRHAAQSAPSPSSVARDETLKKEANEQGRFTGKSRLAPGGGEVNLPPVSTVSRRARRVYPKKKPAPIVAKPEKPAELDDLIQQRLARRSSRGGKRGRRWDRSKLADKEADDKGPMEEQAKKPSGLFGKKQKTEKGSFKFSPSDQKNLGGPSNQPTQGQSVFTLKPPVVSVKASTKLAEGRLMEGLRSLNISGQRRGWRVGSYGLGSVTSWDIKVYKEQWLRWWLMFWSLFAFLLFWRMGVHFPQRKFLLFWGGLLLTGAAALLLQGLAVPVANAWQVGILGAGVTYLWPRKWLSTVNFLNKSSAALGVLLFLGCFGSGQTAHADTPHFKQPPMNSTQVAGPKNWRDWLCHQSLQHQQQLTASPSLPLYAPYDGNADKFRLHAKLSVLVPGGWWELLRMGGDAWCRRLPKQARTFLQAHVQSKVEPGKSVSGSVRFVIQKVNNTPQSIALGLRGLPVTEALYNQLPISLSYANDSYQILLTNKGEHRVEVKFSIPLRPGQQRVTLHLPRAVGASAKVSLHSKASQLVLPGAKGVSLSQRGDISEAYVVLGRRPSFVISWQPKKQPKDEEEESSTVRSESLLTLQPNLVRLQSRFTFRRTYSYFRQVQMFLPEGTMVEGLEARLLRSWNIKTTSSGQRILTVVMEKKLKKATVQVSVVRLRRAGKELLSVPFVVPQGVGIHRGWFGIRKSSGVVWSLREHKQLSQAKLQDWDEDGRAFSGSMDAVYRFQYQPSLSIALSPQKDQRQYSVRHQLFASQRHWELRTTVVIKGKGLPTFRSTFLVPSQGNVSSVTAGSGAQVEQFWFEPHKGLLRKLHVAYATPLASYQTLVVVTKLKGGAEQAIPVFLPDTQAKWSGSYVVYSLGNVGLRTDSLLNLESLIPSRYSNATKITYMSKVWYARLGFHFRQSYQGKLSLQAIKTQRRCRLAIHAHLGASRHQLRAWFRFRATGAGARSFSFSLPEVVAKQMIWSNKGSWVSKLSKPAKGRVVVTLRGIRLKKTLDVAFRYRWTQPLNQAASIPMIRPENIVQGDTLLSVSAPPSIRVIRSKAKTKGLQSLDPEKFPMEAMDRWVNLPGSFNDLEEVPVLATYRTRKANWSLSIPREQLKSDITFRAQADTATLFSQVSRQGEVWTQAFYNVRSAGLQFLKVQLPKGAKLWHTRVRGKLVKPSTVGDVIQIPLPPRQSSDLSYSVQLVFAARLSLPELYGSFAPKAPKLLNLSVVQSFWIVNLPPTFAISDYSGNMEETTSLQLQYHQLQNALGFYRKLESLSQVGKDSTRKRALRNLRQQWSRVKRLMRNSMSGGYSSYDAAPVAAPKGIKVLNEATRKKSNEFRQKIQGLQSTFKDLERRHRRMERRYQKQRGFFQFQQRKRKYRKQKKLYRPKYRRRYRYFRRKGRKGSFLIPSWRRWTPKSLVPESPVKQGASWKWRKPCRQARRRSFDSTSLQLPPGGIRYTFVTVGGNPKLSIDLYRQDKAYRYAGWVGWGVSLLVLLFAWRRKWFSWNPIS